jgi:hypothetical protein
MWIVALIGLLVVGGFAFLRWGTRWGSTAEERAREMPGDEYLEGGPSARVAMTRAISIEAPPERVWPWIAQLGRGAGWYSVDWLDNGRKPSARHLVSWIPEPQLGDATAIGYLRHIEAGRVLVWWADGARFVGSRARLVGCLALDAEGRGTRLITRWSADAAGPTARLALWVFRFIDSIMARRQLLGVRDRVDRPRAELATSRDQETGDRSQYQLYEVLYAAGGRAGVAGKESGPRWRESAMKDGLLEERFDLEADA